MQTFCVCKLYHCSYLFKYLLILLINESLLVSQKQRCGRIAPEGFDACNSREQLVQNAMDWGAGATFAGNQKGREIKWGEVTLSDQNLFAVLDPISHLSFFPSHYDGHPLSFHSNPIPRDDPIPIHSYLFCNPDSRLTI
jgi:hypothetical protein